MKFRKEEMILWNMHIRRVNYKKNRYKYTKITDNDEKILYGRENLWVKINCNLFLNYYVNS